MTTKKVTAKAGPTKAKPAKKAKKAKGRPSEAMRRFVFTGDPKHPGTDPENTTFMGYDFKLNGKDIPVRKEAAEKLSGHSHFTEK